MSDPPSLILPSEIPWDRLTSQVLEELLYWLCVETGGKDVQWRTGTGGPSADGGRDIEATFHVPDDEGTLEPKRWWIQAKGRSRTVEPLAVKEAVITAAGFGEIDTVVIATNAAFSNPTRDWVAEFNRTHERPTAVLWPRERLEEMIVANPSALLRVAPEAFSPQGMAAVIDQRFQNAARIPSEGEIQFVWEHRDEIELSSMATLALAAGELERGSLAQRPWVVRTTDDVALLALCAFGLANLPPLVIRAIQFRNGEGPLLRLGEHLLAAALARLPPAAVKALATDPRSIFDDAEPLNDEGLRITREQIYEPIHHNLRRRLGIACAGVDCKRMYAAGDDEDESPIEALLGSAKDAPSNTGIDMEMEREPCAVGLPLGEDVGCPWFRKAPFEEVVDELQFALRARIAAAKGEQSNEGRSSAT